MLEAKSNQTIWAEPLVVGAAFLVGSIWNKLTPLAALSLTKL
jgi:hypothetical protein